MFQSLEKVRSLAVVGATGMAGAEFLELLEEHKVRVPKLRLFASKSSEGKSITVGDIDYVVEDLATADFSDIDVAFFSVSKELSLEYVPKIAAAGCLVIDDSNAFRMNPDVPLVIPEVNGHELKEFEGHIIATPNCSTTPMAMALKPLHDAFGVKRVVVSTYQSVSGAGKKAFEELSQQTVALLNGKNFDIEAFPHRIAFNCLPMIGSVVESGNTDEEEKMINETRKILGIPGLKVSSTTVRVPTFCGHGLSVNVEFEKPFKNIEMVRELLENFEGMQVLDKPESFIYPTNVECAKNGTTFVGRVRRDASLDSGINFWVITDNLRKGAALNAIQTLDRLYAYREIN